MHKRGGAVFTIVNINPYSKSLDEVLKSELGLAPFSALSLP